MLPRIRYRHRHRVSALAVRLGQAIGLSPSALADLWLGAWAHDIGKRAVTADLLDKPGPLTSEETGIIRRHVLIGADIARAMGSPESVALAIRYHHERWDGTGYPDGLAGTAIPLFARVIAIADAYDAMTKNRPYHAGLRPRAALGELTRCAGTQFDPHLTQIFITRVLGAQPVWRSRGA